MIQLQTGESTADDEFFTYRKGESAEFCLSSLIHLKLL